MRSQTFLAFMALLSPSWCNGSQASNTVPKTKTAETSYKHHRILIWTFDGETHAVKGFDEATIGPSQEITPKPVGDFAVTIRAGEIYTDTSEDATGSDATTGQTERMTWTISGQSLTAGGGGFLLGTWRELDEIFLGSLYAGNTASILIGIPVGPSDTKKYLSEIKRLGAADALEDIIFTAAAESECPLDHGEILRAYELLGTSKKLNRWKELLKNGTPDQRCIAAGVLMMLGDTSGRKAFCKFCLESKGDLQFDLVVCLREMPPSDEALATIVKLLVAPAAYSIKVPDGVRFVDEELRAVLVQALSNNYSPESLKPYAAELGQWAKSEMGQEYGGGMVLKLLDVK